MIDESDGVSLLDFVNNLNQLLPDGWTIKPNLMTNRDTWEIYNPDGKLIRGSVEVPMNELGLEILMRLAWSYHDRPTIRVVVNRRGYFRDFTEMENR